MDAYKIVTELLKTAPTKYNGYKDRLRNGTLTVKSMAKILADFGYKVELKLVITGKPVVENQWNLTCDSLPSVGSNVETSQDGITVGETMAYISDRTCMLAGSGGGYLGKGFATDGSSGCETGLSLDPPKYWRYI